MTSRGRRSRLATPLFGLELATAEDANAEGCRDAIIGARGLSTLTNFFARGEWSHHGASVAPCVKTAAGGFNPPTSGIG